MRFRPVRVAHHQVAVGEQRLLPIPPRRARTEQLLRLQPIHRFFLFVLCWCVTPARKKFTPWTFNFLDRSLPGTLGL